MEAFLKKARLASVKKNCLLIDREGHYPTVGCYNENLISLKKDERKLLSNKRNYTLHDPLGLARLWSKTVSLNWGTTSAGTKRRSQVTGHRAQGTGHRSQVTGHCFTYTGSILNIHKS